MDTMVIAVFASVHLGMLLGEIPGFALGRAEVDVARPIWLLPITVVLSNFVSNVPAVVLPLPQASALIAGAALDPLTSEICALSSS